MLLPARVQGIASDYLPRHAFRPRMTVLVLGKREVKRKDLKNILDQLGIAEEKFTRSM